MEKKVIKQNKSNYDFSQNQKFYKSHIAGEQREEKTTNHVGNFDEVKYHKVLKKTKSKKKPQKFKKLMRKRDGQDAFIAKGVTVKEYGSYKAGLTEKNLDFEVAGKVTAGGVMPEHLHRSFEKLWTVEKNASMEGVSHAGKLERVCSQGGTEYLIEAGRPYDGWKRAAVEEGRKSDLDSFGGGTWMDANSYKEDWPSVSSSSGSF